MSISHPGVLNLRATGSFSRRLWARYYLRRCLLFIHLACALLLTAITVCHASAQQQPKKIALVIGNGFYASVTHLNNPPNDANLLAGKLKGLGFTLIGGGVQKDLKLTTFKTAVDRFVTEAANADVAFFYYAGHGVQVNGINYLVPTDSNPSGLADVPKQMVDANSILSGLDEANPRLKILVLDACRNNPFVSRGLLSTGLADMTSGLAQMVTPKGTVIWYATQPGKTASDGAGNNGPFATALAHNLDIPGQDIYGVFNKTALEVMAATNPQQIPWLAATALDGIYYFAGAVGAARSLVPEPEAIFSDLPVDSSADQRVRRLFSTGINTPSRTFKLGETYTAVNSKLDQPFGIRSWTELPIAGEYPGRDVRYFWVRMPALPVLSTALLPPELTAGECVDPQSYVTFLFEHEKLFSVSIRLYKGGSCRTYDWLANYLFSSDHRSALIRDATGDTLIQFHETNDLSLIDVGRLEISNLWLN